MFLNYLLNKQTAVEQLYNQFSIISSAHNKNTFNKVTHLKDEFDSIHEPIKKEFLHLESLGFDIVFIDESIIFSFLLDKNIKKYFRISYYFFNHKEKVHLSDDWITFDILSIISKIEYIFKLDIFHKFIDYHLEIKQLTKLYQQTLINRKSKSFVQKSKIIKDYIRKLQPIEIVEKAYQCRIYERGECNYLFLEIINDKISESLNLQPYLFNKKRKLNFSNLIVFKIQSDLCILDYTK